MSLNLIILFRLNSGDECSLYLALLMQRMAFFLLDFQFINKLVVRVSPE